MTNFKDLSLISDFSCTKSSTSLCLVPGQVRSMSATGSRLQRLGNLDLIGKPARQKTTSKGHPKYFDAEESLVICQYVMTWEQECFRVSLISPKQFFWDWIRILPLPLRLLPTPPILGANPSLFSSATRLFRVAIKKHFSSRGCDLNPKSLHLNVS